MKTILIVLLSASIAVGDWTNLDNPNQWLPDNFLAQQDEFGAVRVLCDSLPPVIPEATWYCTMAGDDQNNGLSMGSGFATIGRAIQALNTSGQPGRIVLESYGTFQAPSPYAASYIPTQDVVLCPSGPVRAYVTPSSSAGYTLIWNKPVNVEIWNLFFFGEATISTNRALIRQCKWYQSPRSGLIIGGSCEAHVGWCSARYCTKDGFASNNSSRVFYFRCMAHTNGSEGSSNQNWTAHHSSQSVVASSCMWNALDQNVQYIQDSKGYFLDCMIGGVRSSSGPTTNLGAAQNAILRVAASQASGLFMPGLEPQHDVRITSIHPLIYRYMDLTGYSVLGQTTTEGW